MAGDPGREAAPKAKTNTAEHEGGGGGMFENVAHQTVQYATGGQLPPVASGAGGAAKPSASEQAFGDGKKKQSKGVSKSGGGTVRDALVRLVNAGKLNISAHTIAQLDALAQVETGGKIASVDTTDDMGVSIGFHQVVLGHKSVEWVIQQAPDAFAKHGIELDMSKTYNVQGWSHPHQIKGIEDPADLRTGDWAERFYAASLEDDAIVAVVKWALKEAKEVDAKTEKAGASSKQSFWEDDTAKTWILECDNNRPGYTGPAVKLAVARGANEAKDREAFLDILADAIIETYEDLEPKMVGYKKLKAKYPHEDDAKLHAMALVKYKPIGTTKATHIVTRISRHIKVPTLAPSAHVAEDHETPVAQVAQQAPAPTPAAAPAPAADHHEAPAPEAKADTKAETPKVAEQKPAEAAAPEPKAPATVAASGHLRVTASSLNVRSTPSTHEHDNIVGSLHHGEEIEAKGKAGEWVSISHKGQTAFAHGSYLEEVKAPAADHVDEVAKEPEPQVRDAAPAPHEKPAQHDKPLHQAVAHHDKPAHVAHEQKPAPEHKPAPVSTAGAVQNHAADQILRGEYTMLLTLVETGFVSLGVATEQLIKFDRDLHGGQISPTGIELVASFPAAIAQHEAQKHAAQHAEKKAAPVEQHAGPAANQTAQQSVAPAPSVADPAHKHPDAPDAAPGAPLPKVALAASNQKLVDELRAMSSPAGAHTAELLERVDTQVQLLGGKHMSQNEYGETKDTNRDQLVASIGDLRKAVAVLEAPDALKTRIYRHIQDISPYFSQFRNVDILEQFQGDKNTRTCNITSTSMALESLGASPASYDSSRLPIVKRVARYFSNEKENAAKIGAQAGKGKGLDQADLHVGSDVTGLRMPDFLELVAIAENCTESSTDEQINQARWDVWKKLLDIYFLETLAKRFKVKTDVKALKVGAANVGNDLFNYGNKKTGKGIYDNYRMGIEGVVDARNNLEAMERYKDDPNAKNHQKYVDAKTKYDTLSAKNQHILAGEGAPMELEQYRQSVLEQVGKPFDQGRAVVIAISGHFTRLQGIAEDHLIIGDPGRWDTGSHRKVLWEEARGMGYFHHYMLMG